MQLTNPLRKTSEDCINSFPQFTTDIEDIDIHFVALFSEKKNAVPILLLHGWPGRLLVNYVPGVLS
jgi:microsomal epoxide hydrolase